MISSHRFPITMSKLANEHSPYLKHAAKQKVDWHPWSEEAFEIARSQDKPLFLSTGAAWCHWCHVMARECFENDDIARIMNRDFINIKLDRDERPDIDKAYQHAVAAMGGGSGWPLSVFLTPEKKPFFGGTYFPPADTNGRPGFVTILAGVADFYRNRRSEVAVFSRRVMEALQGDALEPESISENMIDEAEKKILSTVDIKNGGFGNAPKFPMPGALEFLMRMAARGHETAALAARSMLTAMARGGIHDHLGGGFHRYSVDEAWLIPHFEKMTDGNAGLLNNYSQGYALFGDELFKTAATGILRFAQEETGDPRGGFFASQDADTVAGEGAYFTWTARELARVLSAEENEVFSLHLLHPHGSLPHDPERHVLAVHLHPSEISRKTGKSEEAVKAVIASAREKLFKTRQKRETPLIDTTLYASLNGMMVSAFLRAFMTFGDQTARTFGLKSLERVLEERFVRHSLTHAPGVPALQEDYVYLMDALITAYEATADQRYLQRADEMMEMCSTIFFDDTEGGFFDTEQEVLGTRLKSIEDVPNSSANAIAIMLLLKLAALMGKNEDLHKAEQGLMLFAASGRSMGLHAGAYFCSLDSYYRMVTLNVEARIESDLARAARFWSIASGSSIVYSPNDKQRIVPCTKNACHAPVLDSAALSNFFKNSAA